MNYRAILVLVLPVEKCADVMWGAVVLTFIKSSARTLWHFTLLKCACVLQTSVSFVPSSANGTTPEMLITDSIR